MKWIMYNAFPILLVILAAVMAIMDKDGWGWFLAIGALTAVMPATKDDK